MADSNSTPSLSNQVCIVTGSNTGIGKKVAEEFANRGAHVILACRSVEKTQAVVEEIQKITNNKHVEFLKLDLASFASIHQFVETFLSKGLPLNVLVNNAGVYEVGGTTEDGLEMVLGVSHFGHFLLTNLLLPKLKESTPSKIINVSSDSAWYTKKFDFTDLPGQKLKTSWSSDLVAMSLYSRAKLANVLFTVELDKRLNAEKWSGVSVNAMMPGMVKTEIIRSAGFISTSLWKLGYLFVGKTLEEGADTIVWLTTPDAEKESGKYFKERKSVTIPQQGCNPEDCKRLWGLSEEVTGLKSQ